MKNKKLNPKQAAFVKEYLKHGNATLAATSAGYAIKKPQHAKNAGYALLERGPVKMAIEEARRSLQKESGYNLERAMSEAEDAMAFARDTENANALVKAVELRTKLNGLLIEKQDIRALGAFQIQIVGINRKRDEDE